MGNRDPKKLAFVDALIDSFGVTSVACKVSGISKEQVEEWMQEDEKFASGFHGLKEKNLDKAEASLIASIKEGNPAATIFYLQTFGGSRGYGTTNRTE